MLLNVRSVTAGVLLLVLLRVHHRNWRLRMRLMLVERRDRLLVMHVLAVWWHTSRR
jgi:hypothetical protein